MPRLGPCTYLLGPEANRFAPGNSDLFRRRRLVRPALHHRRIDQHLSIMVEHADATLDTWRPGQVVDVCRRFRSAIRRGTIHSLFGRGLAGDEAFFGEQLRVLLDLVDRPTSLAAMRPRDGLPALVSAPRPAGRPAR